MAIVIQVVYSGFQWLQHHYIASEPTRPRPEKVYDITQNYSSFIEPKEKCKDYKGKEEGMEKYFVAYIKILLWQHSFTEDELQNFFH
jgi:hypothetical protein